MTAGTAVGVVLLWCDARVTAGGLYEGMGFTVVTGEYGRPGIGSRLGIVGDLRQS